MVIEDVLEHFEDDIRVEAAKAAHRFQVSFLDVRQEIVAALTARADDLTEQDLDSSTAQRMVRRRCEDAARSYGEREKAARGGYEVSDLYFYSKPQIEDLLPYVFDAPTLTRGGDAPVGVTPNHSEGNNLLAMVADIQSACHALCDAHELAFLYTATRGYSWAWVGDVHDINEKSASQKYRRLVARIQRHLGGRKPQPTRRRVMSNATAVAITGREYDG